MTVTLTCKDKEIERTATLAPVDRLDGWTGRTVAVQTAASVARGKLGDLVKEAAQGVPQVLTRRGRQVAVLLDLQATRAPRAASGRRLVSVGEVMEGVTTQLGLSFGLPPLDGVVRGISRSRLTLVAARPGAGGSLLGIAAARQTSLADGRSLLYAASGLSRTDVMTRLVASHAGVRYVELRSGELGEEDVARVRQAETEIHEQHRDKILIDDGSGLDAAAIRESCENWPATPLSLVVVDRLQRVADPQLPLSGAAVEDAARDLARLARQTQVPVLAVVDSDDPEFVATLDADVTLTLARMGQATRIDVAERDMGYLTSVVVEPDMQRARFLPIPARAAERLLRDDVEEGDATVPATAPAPSTTAAEQAPPPAADDTLGEEAQPSPAPAPLPVPEPAAAAAGDAEADAAAPAPEPVEHRPGSWPAAVTQAATAAAAAHVPAAGENAAPAPDPDDMPEEDPTSEPDQGRRNMEYGPFAVIDAAQDGTLSALLASGKRIPCRARTLPELVAWTADRNFGTPRLNAHGRDGDPLAVLTTQAALALGLPESIGGADRALPADHQAIADLAAHGWQLPQRGDKPWFSTWARIYQKVERGRRSVQLAVLPWGALTAGGWPLPFDKDTKKPLSTPAEVVKFLREFSNRFLTPVGTTAVTGQEMMRALRPRTRAWREESTGKLRPKWNTNALLVPVDPAPPEATKDHPLAEGRDEKDPSQVLHEEALQWFREPTDEERRMPFVVGIDIHMAFFAACNGTILGRCAPYTLEHPAFDKKLAGSWLEDLSGVPVDPLLPSPFTPDGRHPTGPGWYQTYTVALATEMGHTPRPQRAHVRPTEDQAKRLGLAPHPDRYDEARKAAGPVPPFGAGTYLRDWYDHINRGYLQTMAELGLVHGENGKALAAREYLDAWAEVTAKRRPKNVMKEDDFENNLLLLAAIKQNVKGAIGKYQEGPHDYGRRALGKNARWKALDRPDWRPDHRAAIIARSRAVMNRKIMATAKATGARPLGVNVDCIAYASPTPDILWLTGHSGGFTVGPNPGFVKMEGVQSMDWLLQTIAAGKNPASQIKDGRTSAARDGE
ncbi:type II toxin-antitoxin system prevent-host-death family antitoxin [Streptomyces sp. NBC_00470]|uniref:type II toxin-antitoxin system prevent-host-death family antitoxin n=1 Tax=Streptomyces sp. NBC_00470 TaxID=2975753 RepID=UPI002F916D7C